MRNIPIFIIATLTMLLPCIGSTYVHDPKTIQTRMINDLEIIRNTFEIKYAPSEWKKFYSNIDFDELVRLAKVKVIASEDLKVKGFQRILKRLFKSLHDLHVDIYFYSTASASLPFRIKSAHGKYYIAQLDHSYDTLISVGDEVISFDGVPIQDAIKDFIETELSDLNSKTDQTLAEGYLTFRIGPNGHKIPSGKIKLITKPKYYEYFDDESYFLETEWEWNSTPEEVLNGPYSLEYDEVSQINFDFKTSSKNFFNKEMIATYYHPSFEDIQTEQNTSDKNSINKIFGHRNTLLPKLGEILWQTEETHPFEAYLCATPEGKKIGFIRIPIYTGKEAEARAFSEIINCFENESDLLIIDQMNNPGGNVFHMYALASMLVKEPLIVMPHKMTITQEDAFFCIDSLKAIQQLPFNEAAEKLGFQDTVNGYPVTPELFTALSRAFNFILQEWNSGKTLTANGHVFGLETLTPHPWGSYTKPILFLVNELSASCGDFLPAILQDNNRATIMGTKTAGAGGYVLEHSYPNRFGIQRYRFTGSIAERQNGQPIENLGVTPDIVYEITPRDIAEEYVDYFSAIHAVIQQMLP